MRARSGIETDGLGEIGQRPIEISTHCAQGAARGTCLGIPRFEANGLIEIGERCVKFS